MQTFEISDRNKYVFIHYFTSESSMVHEFRMSHVFHNIQDESDLVHVGLETLIP